MCQVYVYWHLPWLYRQIYSRSVSIELLFFFFCLCLNFCSGGALGPPFILSRFLSAKVSVVSSYGKLIPELASSHMVSITFSCKPCRFWGRPSLQDSSTWTRKGRWLVSSLLVSSPSPPFLLLPLLLYHFVSPPLPSSHLIFSHFVSSPLLSSCLLYSLFASSFCLLFCSFVMSLMWSCSFLSSPLICSPALSSPFISSNLVSFCLFSSSYLSSPFLLSRLA